jgi:cell division septum initiation protein DivIVA
MSAQQSGDGTGVVSIQELERRLADREAADRAAESCLSAARQHAERILVEARQRADQRAREERTEAMSSSEIAEAALVREARDDLAALRQEIAREHDTVVDALLDVVLPAAGKAERR